MELTAGVVAGTERLTDLRERAVALRQLATSVEERVGQVTSELALARTESERDADRIVGLRSRLQGLDDRLRSVRARLAGLAGVGSES